MQYCLKKKLPRLACLYILEHADMSLWAGQELRGGASSPNTCACALALRAFLQCCCAQHGLSSPSSVPRPIHLTVSQWAHAAIVWPLLCPWAHGHAVAEVCDKWHTHCPPQAPQPHPREQEAYSTHRANCPSRCILRNEFSNSLDCAPQQETSLTDTVHTCVPKTKVQYTYYLAYALIFYFVFSFFLILVTTQLISWPTCWNLQLNKDWTKEI